MSLQGLVHGLVEMKDPRKKLWVRRWAIAQEVLNRHDPVGLISIGAPPDEYDPEMPGVLRAIESASDKKNLADKIENVFGKSVCFDNWPALADELWQISRAANW